MLLRAKFEEENVFGGNEYHCHEVSRVLHMGIPVAMVVNMPSTYSAIGNTQILLYFPESYNAIVYSTELFNYKLDIEKITNIIHWDEQKKIKEYHYVVELMPFLQPSKDGVHRYFIDFSLTRSRWLELRINYFNCHEDRHNEYLELWYYDNELRRCKNPKKIASWHYHKETVNDQEILLWKTTDGTPLKEGMRVPHIMGYHEQEYEYGDD